MVLWVDTHARWKRELPWCQIWSHSLMALMTTKLAWRQLSVYSDIRVRIMPSYYDDELIRLVIKVQRDCTQACKPRSSSNSTYLSIAHRCQGSHKIRTAICCHSNKKHFQNNSCHGVSHTISNKSDKITHKISRFVLHFGRNIVGIS